MHLRFAGGYRKGDRLAWITRFIALFAIVMVIFLDKGWGDTFRKQTAFL